MIFLWFGKTDQVIQNPMPKFRQTTIISEKTSFFVWKIENFDELQLPYCSMFLAETSHTFSAYQYLQKDIRDFFYFV